MDPTAIESPFTKTDPNKMTSADVIEFECHQRQIKNELGMKRAQIESLKTDIDSVNLKIHEATSSLDKMNIMLDEKRTNLGIITEIVVCLEEKLKKDMDESRPRIGIEILVEENEKLRKVATELQKQKLELIEELVEKRKQYDFNMTYHQSEIMKEHVAIKALLDEVTDACKHTERDQNKFINHAGENNILARLEKLLNWYKHEYEKVVARKTSLQNQLITNRSSINMLENRIKQNEKYLSLSVEEVKTIQQLRTHAEESAVEIRNNCELIEILKQKVEGETHFLLQCEKRMDALGMENEKLEGKLKKDKREVMVQTEADIRPSYVVKELTIITDLIEILD